MERIKLTFTQPKPIHIRMNGALLVEQGDYLSEQRGKVSGSEDTEIRITELKPTVHNVITAFNLIQLLF